MVCSIIDECRCYAYNDVQEPKKTQFCGVRRGPHVVPCPESDCCAGGCPGEVSGLTPREPFRIIERSTIPQYFVFDPTLSIFFILVLLSVLFLTYLT